MWLLAGLPRGAVDPSVAPSLQSSRVPSLHRMRQVRRRLLGSSHRMRQAQIHALGSEIGCAKLISMYQLTAIKCVKLTAICWAKSLSCQPSDALSSSHRMRHVLNHPLGATTGCAKLTAMHQAISSQPSNASSSQPSAGSISQPTTQNHELAQKQPRAPINTEPCVDK